MRAAFNVALYLAFSVAMLGASAAQSYKYRVAIVLDTSDPTSIAEKGSAWKIVFPKLLRSLQKNGLDPAATAHVMSEYKDISDLLARTRDENDDYVVISTLYLNVNDRMVPKVRMPIRVFDVKAGTVVYSKEPESSVLPALPSGCDVMCLTDHVSTNVTPVIDQVAETIASKIAAAPH